MEIYSWRKIGKIFLMKCSTYEILSWICPRKKIIWIQKSELVMRILRSITYLHHKINRFSMSCEVANKMLYCNFLPLWKSSSTNNLRLKKLMIPNTSKRKKLTYFQPSKIQVSSILHWPFQGSVAPPSQLAVQGDRRPVYRQSVS